jgi:hypothetical protein
MPNFVLMMPSLVFFPIFCLVITALLSVGVIAVVHVIEARRVRPAAPQVKVVAATPVRIITRAA